MNQTENESKGNLNKIFLSGVIFLIIANGFYFYNIINTNQWWFVGVSVESVGFLIFGFIGFYLAVFHNSGEMRE